MKVLFLDFNGVLNTFVDQKNVGYLNLQILKYIVSSTDAKVVVTDEIKNSIFFNGRFQDEYLRIVDLLLSNGIDVIDYTSYKESKELEINYYLNTHPDITEYCVLGSNLKFSDESIHYVSVPKLTRDEPYGLLQYHADKVCDILGRVKKDNSTLKKTSNI